MTRTLALGLLAAALVVPLLAGAADSRPQVHAIQAAAPGSLAASEQFLLHSEKIGQTFLIQVAKPHVPLPPGTKPPVIYATDGMITFGLVTSLMRTMFGEGLVPQAYVVAIGYPEEQILATTTLRLRDLMHRPAQHRTGGVQGGGGGAFEQFLLDELRPLIESRYAVDANRSVLLGFSLGGLFAANVLANHPDAFSGYVIGSPSMHYDDVVADAVRKAGSRGAGRRVFIGVGELEPQMIPRADLLQNALAGSAFLVSRKTFPAEAHSSVPGALASHGLRFVFTQPPKAEASP